MMFRKLLHISIMMYTENIFRGIHSSLYQTGSKFNSTNEKSLILIERNYKTGLSWIILLDSFFAILQVYSYKSFFHTTVMSSFTVWWLHFIQSTTIFFKRLLTPSYVLYQYYTLCNITLHNTLNYVLCRTECFNVGVVCYNLRYSV